MITAYHTLVGLMFSGALVISHWGMWLWGHRRGFVRGLSATALTLDEIVQTIDHASIRFGPSGGNDTIIAGGGNDTIGGGTSPDVLIHGPTLAPGTTP